MRPANGAGGVLRDSFVAVDLNLPNGAVDASTVTTANISLKRNDTGAVRSPPPSTRPAAATRSPSRPREILPANVDLHLHHHQRRQGRQRRRVHRRYSGTFTTGSSVAESNPRVAFDRTVLSNTVGIAWTGATIGPDGKFYGVTANGEIYRSAINSDGTLSTPALLFSYESRRPARSA